MEPVRTDGGRSVRGRSIFGCRFLISWRQHAHVVVNVARNVVVNVVRKQFATLEIHVVGPGPARQKEARRKEMVRTDDERGKRRSSSVLPFDMMGSDGRRPGALRPSLFLWNYEDEKR